jgi:hypothetical protein
VGVLRKTEEKVRRLMLSKIFEIKPCKFQVLFLRNDDSERVEVHEVKEVDFLTIQERLENGESVFITKKNSQKISPPKQKSRVPRSMKTKLVTAFYLDRV